MGKIKRKYTLGEEIFSSVSHGVGACLSIAGTVVLLVFSVIYGNALAVVSSAIYGASLIILYTMSTLYHSFTNERVKHFFQIMDHNTIFLLIAGTYTPITLYILGGAESGADRHGDSCGNPKPNLSLPGQPDLCHGRLCVLQRYYSGKKCGKIPQAEQPGALCRQGHQPGLCTGFHACFGNCNAFPVWK